ncbi:MAG TPA: universal stress protein [Burkholderiales bacterium]|nr:universal stress protein [Burkholderiales bacterium]
MPKLLLPIDGSIHSLNAARHVANLARAGGPIELHVLHVEEQVSERTHAFLSQEEIRELQEKDARKRCQNVLDFLRDEGLQFIWHITVGDPGHEIARYAKKNSVDCIVMGTRGMNPLAELLLGSVVSRVIHEADLPVTVVK